MTSSPVVHSDMTPYQEEFDNILRNYRIIDVGTILHVSEDGAACTVQGFNVQNGIVQTYKDVELLYPAGITLGITGCPCILFRPATPVQNIQQNTLLNTCKLHTESSVKAVPLFFNHSNAQVGFVNGNYTIKTDFYTVTFSESGIEISLSNGMMIVGDPDIVSLSMGTYTINMDPDGTSETLYKDTEGNFISRSVYNPEDGSFTYYSGATAEPEDDELDDLDTFTKWTWIKKITPDGAIDIKKQDADENTLDSFTMDAEGNIQAQQLDADGNVLNSISIDKDGVSKTTIGDNITIDTDQDGNISVTNTKGTITIDKDGNMSFEADGDISVKGKNVTVEASSKTVVKGTNVELNGATKATGTSFECGGSVAPTGSGALCGLPSCLFTGAPHVGNKALGV